MTARKRAIGWQELIGRRAARAIEERSLKIPDVAAQLQAYLGEDRWPRQAVYDLKKGRRRVDVGDLCALSLVLDRPIHWFLQPDEPGLELDLGRKKVPPPTAGESAASTTMKHYAQLAIEDLGNALLSIEDVRALVDASLDNARTQAAIAETLDTKNGGH